MRVKRHDAVVDLLIDALRAKGFEIRRMTTFKTAEGRRVPDIVALKDNKVHVIDPCVVGDRENPDGAFDRKVEYYSSCVDIKRQLVEERPGAEVTFGSFAVTYKGVVSKKSDEYLRGVVGLSKGVLARATLRAIKGSLLCHWVHSMTTENWNPLKARRLRWTAQSRW